MGYLHSTHALPNWTATVNLLSFLLLIMLINHAFCFSFWPILNKVVEKK